MSAGGWASMIFFGSAILAVTGWSIALLMRDRAARKR